MQHVSTVKYNVSTVCVLLWLGQVMCIRWAFIHTSCVSVCECEYMRDQSVNQPFIEVIVHSIGVWLSSICCQLFDCIVLQAGCLFKQSLGSHSPCMSAQTCNTHTHRFMHTNVCLCNLKNCSHYTAHHCWGYRVCSVWLFVHLEVVCYATHHSQLVVMEYNLSKNCSWIFYTFFFYHSSTK